VIGQIDYRREKLVFGAMVENKALCYWKYRNCVFALLATGPGAAGIGAHNRLIGTEGIIEVGVNPDGPTLRVRRKGSVTWDTLDVGNETLHGPNCIQRALADVIEALQTSREPELSARKALNATEIIFACYESSRRRGRVDLPLKISDNPLQAMVESGDLRPAPAR
jgi:predicted dehydrogenase